MKIITTQFSIFLLTIQMTFAQTSVYHPFPDSDAVWNLNFYNYCLANVTNENYSMSFSGDTTINGQNYHKLKTSQIQVITNFCGIETTSGYKGAIRNDIANKKVFFVPPTSNTEELLYDFNLQIGDTVVGYFEETISNFPEIVQSVDSVLVEDDYRKRWIINPLYDVYFIEGIGSTYGLIELLPGGNISELPQRSINCFSQDGISIYPSSPTFCNVISNVPSSEKKLESIKIFPNPFSEQTMIQSDNDLNEARLTLYNSFGKLVKQIDHISGQSMTLFRDELPSGIYFLNLIQDKKLIKTQKLIIID